MIIVALDVDTREKALELVDSLKEQVSYFKIGMQLFNSQGPDIISVIKDRGVKVFLDLKFHDIPNTVAAAAAVAVRQGADMFNVHASGGEAMLRTAAESVKETTAKLNLKENPIVLGVTVLTSMSEETLQTEIGIIRSLEEQVSSLALLCRKAGLNGVVASPREVVLIREACGPEFLIVTPGVRPFWSSRDDQERVHTPAEAMALGSNFLVIGRPVTAAPDPKEALNKIIEEINKV
ncbi:MAG: orotidine-5'-phosphate decarboxylase [Firmicutes bacterium HGW-Firmicutes-13]|nr:MAG: orotidine-5'-phosphate decarboxylase [Firmicutes bacterium HGW-Firmicutes-13]